MPIQLSVVSARTISAAKILQAVCNEDLPKMHPAGNQSMVKMEEKVRTIQVLRWIGQVLTSLVTLPSRGLQDYMKLRHASPQTPSTKNKRGCEDKSDLCEDAMVEHDEVRREGACQGDSQRRQAYPERRAVDLPHQQLLEKAYSTGEPTLK